MIAQFVIAVALVAVTCNKALQSPTIRLARPMITRRCAFKEHESMDFTSKMGANSQLVVSSNVGTPMKSTTTGTIADTSSFTLADASVFGFGSLIALAVIPIIAFLAWQKISKPADDASTEIRVSGERSLREEEIKTIREKAQKEEGTRSSLIANARADVEKRVAEAKRQDIVKEKQQPVEKESVVQLLEQEFKKEVVVVKTSVTVVVPPTEEEKKMKERAVELAAKEQAAVLARRKAEAEAMKAAKYAAIQKKEQAAAEAAARTRAAAAAAVAAAPKVVPVASPPAPAPAPAPVVIPVTPVEAIWEVPEVDTKEAAAAEKALKKEAEEFARMTLEKQKRKELHEQERRQAAELRIERYKVAEAAKAARYLALQNREKAKENAARALLQSITNTPVKVAPSIPSPTPVKAKEAEGDHTWEVPEVDFKEEPESSVAKKTPAVPPAAVAVAPKVVPVTAPPTPSPAPAPAPVSTSTPGFSEKWDDAAMESLESVAEESLPLKYGAAAEKPEMKIFDEMQAAAEKEGAAMESAGSGVKGALDEAITLMAKAPLSKLRDLIRKYKPSVLPPDDSKIGFAGDNVVLSIHLRAGLDATWSASGGSWEKLMTLLREELGQQAEDTTSWMRAAMKAAEDIPEARIKTLIKQYGGPEAMPKKRGASKEGKMEKKVYDTTLVDVLRASFGNDYQQVAKMLQEESSKGGQRKGFGGK